MRQVFCLKNSTTALSIKFMKLKLLLQR